MPYSKGSGSTRSMSGNKPKAEVDPILDWMKDVQWVKETKGSYRRIMVYGPAGAGKTRFIGTCPKPFILDSDKGLMTLRNLKIPYLPLVRGQKVYTQVIDAIKAARKRQSMFKDIETFAIDSLTSLADMLMIEVMKFPGEGRTPKDPTKSKPEWDHYTAVAARLAEIVKRCADLDMNVVFTCGVKLEKDDILGKFEGKPNVVGGYRDKVSHDFDEVYYMDTEGTGKNANYILFTGKYRYFEAKSREGLEYQYKDPSYEKLFGGAK